MNVAQMIDNIYRVLVPGGFYVAVSYSADRAAQIKREHVNFSV